MANGQKMAVENHAAFAAWASTKSDDDFREYVHKGRLKRSEIAHECGFGRSALVQNPAIKSALEALEDGLRERGILPPLNDTPVDSAAPVHDWDAKQRRQDSQRVNAVEQENAALRAELAQAKAMLDRYQLMSLFMEETGRLPR